MIKGFGLTMLPCNQYLAEIKFSSINLSLYSLIWLTGQWRRFIQKLYKKKSLVMSKNQWLSAENYGSSGALAMESHILDMSKWYLFNICWPSDALVRGMVITGLDNTCGLSNTKPFNKPCLSLKTIIQQCSMGIWSIFLMFFFSGKADEVIAGTVTAVMV